MALQESGSQESGSQELWNELSNEMRKFQDEELCGSDGTNPSPK